MKMHESFIRAGIGILCLMVVGAAILVPGVEAGDKESFPVSVTPGAFAGGSLADTRSLPENTSGGSYIGCVVDWQAGGVTTGTCGAYRSGQGSVSCTTSDPTAIQIILSVKGDSYLEFGSDKHGACTFIYAYTTSYLAPKVP